MCPEQRYNTVVKRAHNARQHVKESSEVNIALLETRRTLFRHLGGAHNLFRSERSIRFM